MFYRTILVTHCNIMFQNEPITCNNFMKLVISFKMLRRTNSKLPFLLFIDTFVGVDSRGADCTKSKYSVLWALPIPRAFGA